MLDGTPRTSIRLLDITTRHTRKSPPEHKQDHLNGNQLYLGNYNYPHLTRNLLYVHHCKILGHELPRIPQQAS